MANNSDFNVSFGSNARSWAKRLNDDLQPARDTILGMAGALDTLNTNIARVKASGKGLEGLAGISSDGSGAATPVTRTPGGQVIDPSFLAQVERDVASITAGMEGVVKKMSLAAEILERSSKTVKGNTSTQNRSDAQRNSPTSQANNGYVFRKGVEIYDTQAKDPRQRVGGRSVRPEGNRYHGGDGRLLSVEELGKFITARESKRPSSGGGEQVSISGTPTVLVQEASFARLVQAIEKGTSQVRSTKQSVREIVGLLKSGGLQTPVDSGRRAPSRTHAAAQVLREDPSRATEKDISFAIERRERLAALKKERARVQQGGAFDPELFAAASSGSKKLSRVGERTEFSGDKYEASLSNAIKTLQEELRGVPSINELRTLIADAPAIQASRSTTTSMGEPIVAKAAKKSLDEADPEVVAQLENTATLLAENEKLLARAVNALSKVDPGSEKAAELKALIETAKSSVESTKSQFSEMAKASGLSRKDTSAIRRMPSEIDRASERNQLTQRQRYSTQRNIDLAGADDLLKPRGGLEKNEFRSIIKSFQQEGYEPQVDPDKARISNDELIAEIKRLRAMYSQTGGITRHNLKLNDGFDASEIAPETQKMVKSVLKALKKSAAELDAFSISAMNLRTGGQPLNDMAGAAHNNPLSWVTGGGLGKTAKGRTEIGSAFGGEAGRALVAKAEETIQEYFKRTTQGSVDFAVKQTQTRGFNPYRPELDQGATGATQEAEETRRALFALRRATDAVDGVMSTFVALDREATALREEIKAANSEITAIERSATQTPEDFDRMAALRARKSDAERQERYLREKADALQVTPNTSARSLATPQFRQDLEARNQARAARQAELDRRSMEQRERRSNDQALDRSITDYLMGTRSRTHLGSGKTGPLGPEKFTQTIPGLYEKGGKLFPKDSQAKVDNKDLRDLNSKFRDFSKSVKDLTQETEGSAEWTAQNTRMLEKFQAFLGVYEKMGLGISKLSVDQERQELRYMGGDDASAPRDSKKKAATSSAPSAEAKELTKVAEAISLAPKSGGGKGGGKPPVTPASAGMGEAGDRAVLERILARLDAIHATMKNGSLKVTQGTSRTATKKAEEAPKELPQDHPRREVPVGPLRQDDQAKADQLAKEEAAAQRKREERRKAVEAADRRERIAAEQRAAERRVGGTPSQGKDVFENLVDEANLGRLSDQTRRYAVELKALSAAQADASQIAAKQVQLYASMNQDFQNSGISAQGRRVAYQSVAKDAGTEVNQERYTKISRTAASVYPSLAGKQSGAAYADGMAESVQDVIAQKLFGNHGFWSRVMNSTGTFLVRNFTAGAVFGLSAALQDVVSQAIETESTFIRVSHALEATGRATGDLRTGLQDISTDYGVALLGVYETAAGLAGLFETIPEIESATRVVAQLEMISNGALNATEGMGALASITSAFDMQDNLKGVEGLEHVADVLTTIQNRLGVNLEVSAEGVARLSGLAAQIGLTFEETAVYVSEIAKRTNQTGAAAGEQFSRIVSVMQTGRGQKALTDSLGDQGIGSALAAGDYSDALKILMENYQGLSEAQQDNIATTLGGQRQAAAMAALLKDGAGALDVVAAATNEQGAAAARAAAISETLNRQIGILQSNFVNLGAALVQSGLLSVFSVALQGVNAFLGAVNKVLSVMNRIASSSPFLEMLKNVAVGALAAVAALRVMKASLAGFKHVLNSDGVGGAMARGFAAPVIGGGVGGGVGGRAPVGRMARDSFVRMATTPLIGTSEGGNTRAFGRALERVTSGPLQKFGGSVQDNASKLRTLAKMQADAGLNGRARFSRGTARASELVGRGTSGFGLMVQEGLRGETPIANRAARGLSYVGGAMESRQAETSSKILGRSYGAVANTANRAASATSKIAAGIQGIGLAGMGAQAGMAALTIAIMAFVSEMARAKEFADDLKNAYESQFTKDGRMTEEEKEERYIGPATDLVKKNREDLYGGTGLTRAWVDVFKLDNTFRNVDEIGDRNAGILDEKMQEPLNDFTNSIFDSYRNVSESARAGNAKVEDVQNLQSSLLEELDTEASRIFDDNDMSDAQKATALSQVESARKIINDRADAAMRLVNGLDSATKLASARIQEISEYMSFTSSVPTAGANHMEAIRALEQEFGGTDGVLSAFQVMTSGNATMSEVLSAQQEVQDRLISEATSALQSAQEEDRADRAKTLMGLLSQSEQLRNQIIENEINSAQETATWLEGVGNDQGAIATLDGVVASMRDRVMKSRARKNREALGERFKGYTPGPGEDPGEIMTPDEETSTLNMARQLEKENLEKRISLANLGDRQSAMMTRNSVRLANLELSMANRRVRMLKDAGATDMELLDAQEAATTAAYGAQDAQQALIQARYQAQAAGILNSVSRARVEEGGAWQAASAAQASYGANSVEYLSALASARQASIATRDTILEEAQAHRDLLVTRKAPGDTLGQARQTLSNALKARADAARFGTSSAQYAQATAAVIEAQRGVRDAVFEVTRANYGLAIAMADASGKTVDSARLQLRQARAELKNAQKRAGGKRTTEVINAEAGVKSANASLRDATLQDRRDTIDFQLEMDQITSRGAISMLTELLNMKDLTEAQRREILLKIKSLEDELSSTLDGVFNLPDDIKVPTVYEVRRAMGVDEYMRSMKDATDVQKMLAPGATKGEANAILGGIQKALSNGGSVTPSSVQDYSNSNNVVNITGADFDKVVKYLEDVLGPGAQVVRSTSGRK